MPEPIHTISIWSILKNIAYVPAIFLGLSHDSYAILAVFMVIDTILGVTRVGIVHGGSHIRSYKLTAGIIAKVCVVLVPLLTVWAGRGVGIDLSLFAQWTLGALILAQFYSILSNIFSIHKREDVDEFDAVSFVLKKLRAIIEKMLKEEGKRK